MKTANLRDAIGIALIASFVGALTILFWKAIPRENEQLIVYMLGQLSGFVSGIVAYHYVTKAGEKELEQQRAVNTEKAFEAVKAATESLPRAKDPDALHSGDTVEISKEGEK